MINLISMFARTIMSGLICVLVDHNRSFLELLIHVFGRTSDDSEIVAPLALHLRRVDKGETYIQCLVLEAGLYQNYGREERKGNRKKNKMMNRNMKRRRRREGGGEAQSVMLLCT